MDPFIVIIITSICILVPSLIFGKIGSAIGKPKKRAGFAYGFFLWIVGIILVIILPPLGRKCPSCGGIVEDGFSVCKNCGRDIPIIAEQSKDVAGSITNAGKNESNIPKKSKVLISNGVISLTCLALGIYFLVGAIVQHSLIPVLYGGRYATRLVATGGWDGLYLFIHQILGKLLGISDPTIVIGIVIGCLPIIFGIVFFSISFFRKISLDSKNRK